MVHVIEILLLSFVVMHAAQHLPHDVRRTCRAVRDLLDRVMRNRPMPYGADPTLAIVMALASMTALAPSLYYSLECSLRIFAPHAA